MFSYQYDAEAYAVSSRPTPSRTKPARTAYSPRHENRRGKSGSLTSLAHKRTSKRNGL